MIRKLKTSTASLLVKNQIKTPLGPLIIQKIE
jgi:hypothetical protein